MNKAIRTLYNLALGAKRHTSSFEDYITQIRKCPAVIQDYFYGLVNTHSIGKSDVIFCSKPAAFSLIRDQLSYAKATHAQQAYSRIRQHYSQLIQATAKQPDKFWIRYSQHAPKYNDFLEIIKTMDVMVLQPALGISQLPKALKTVAGNQKQKLIKELRSDIRQSRNAYQLADNGVTISDWLDMHEDRLGIMRFNQLRIELIGQYIKRIRQGQLNKVPNIHLL